jgi:type I restriction enzyme S subunit
MKIDVLDQAELHTDYLHNYLLSPDFLERLYATANGTRQANLSSKTILTLSVPIPSFAIQEQIIEQLDNLSEQIKQIEAEYQHKLDDLSELRKSILQKAFAGELI